LIAFLPGGNLPAAVAGDQFAGILLDQPQNDLWIYPVRQGCKMSTHRECGLSSGILLEDLVILYTGVDGNAEFSTHGHR
jgi:hypothetical protein